MATCDLQILKWRQIGYKHMAKYDKLTWILNKLILDIIFKGGYSSCQVEKLVMHVTM